MVKLKENSIENIESLGEFYLGKIVNSKDGKLTDKPLLYESKDLTTHAVCLGMTGSGKTGLGIAMLEEAALDRIPAIIIDPKGDLGNLCLTFPSLNTNEFVPWIDTAEAERKGMSVDDYAASIAKTWKEGLAKWDEKPERVQQFRNSTDVVIYTPASKAGIPLSILASFAVPSKEMMLDSTAVRDRISSITSSLLGLLGISADPIKSREHILISTLINHAWDKGKDLDIASLIRQVQEPPFSKIGVLDVETFYPTKERMALSVSLNNLLASPGFQAWMQGESLDISRLLHTPEGKPKLSVISIAHLTDPERMFFVTILLNEILSWMHRQSGTTNLRAILYMDEIFGYFPPTSMPPSKIPMLTLLKQARAFGLGIVLATQNPVDLDYKGLSNTGTWFIGKLQTERDKARVLDGLTLASNGEISANELNKMLALTGNRVFIMRSIHEKDPILFQTRWTLSYLRGPLTLSQISKLTDHSAKTYEEQSKEVKEVSTAETKPIIPQGISEYFLHSYEIKTPFHYVPEVVGLAKLHFVDSKNKVDTWQDVCMIVPYDEREQTVRWEEGTNDIEAKRRLEDTAMDNAKFDELPAGLMQKKNFDTLEKNFGTALYQNQILTIYKSSEFNLISENDESEDKFRERVKSVMDEKREEIVEKLKAKYADKITALNEKIRKIEDKASLQKNKWYIQIGETILSFLTTILSALAGKKLTKGTITQTGTSMRKIGRVTKEGQEASQTEDNLTNAQQQLQDLKDQLQSEIDKLSSINAENAKIDSIEIRPRKSDISVEKVALVWCPKKT